MAKGMVNKREFQPVRETDIHQIVKLKTSLLK
jgi:hypothetical protein